jgi:hypothetical protein
MENTALGLKLRQQLLDLQKNPVAEQQPVHAGVGRYSYANPLRDLRANYLNTADPVHPMIAGPKLVTDFVNDHPLFSTVNPAGRPMSIAERLTAGRVADANAAAAGTGPKVFNAVSSDWEAAVNAAAHAQPAPTEDQITTAAHQRYLTAQSARSGQNQQVAQAAAPVTAEQPNGALPPGQMAGEAGSAERNVWVQNHYKPLDTTTIAGRTEEALLAGKTAGDMRKWATPGEVAANLHISPDSAYAWGQGAPQ